MRKLARNIARYKLRRMGYSRVNRILYRHWRRLSGWPQRKGA